jgi:hypothetical protein
VVVDMAKRLVPLVVVVVVVAGAAALFRQLLSV